MLSVKKHIGILVKDLFLVKEKLSENILRGVANADCDTTHEQSTFCTTNLLCNKNKNTSLMSPDYTFLTATAARATEKDYKGVCK